MTKSSLIIISLLYADDLMLSSTSKAGLQRCIDKLASYSEDNCITVNLKKTKIVVFCKSGKLSKEIFYFNGTEIQNTGPLKMLFHYAIFQKFFFSHFYLLMVLCFTIHVIEFSCHFISINHVNV